MRHVTEFDIAQKVSVTRQPSFHHGGIRSNMMRMIVTLHESLQDDQFNVEEIIPGEYIHCIVHPLQYVVKDGLKLKKAAHLNKVLQKASRLLSLVHKLSIIYT